LAIPFLVLISGRDRHRPTAAPVRPWRLIGALGVAFASSQSLFFLAIPLAGVTLVVIISMCSTVFFVALLSIPLFRERLTRRGQVAVALAVVGTITLALAGQTAPRWPERRTISGVSSPPSAPA
jgi:drug/metabolite transporter (DMT)-like permease